MPRKKNFLFESLATSFGNRYNSDSDLSPCPTEALPAHHTIVLGLPGHEHIQDAAEQAQAAYKNARLVQDGRRRIDESFCACKYNPRRIPTTTISSKRGGELDVDDGPSPAAAAAIFATFSRDKDEQAQQRLLKKFSPLSFQISSSSTAATTRQPPSETRGSTSSVLASLRERWRVFNTKDPIDLAYLATLDVPERAGVHVIAPVGFAEDDALLQTTTTTTAITNTKDSHPSDGETNIQLSTTTTSSESAPPQSHDDSTSDLPPWLHRLLWAAEHPAVEKPAITPPDALPSATTDEEEAAAPKKKRVRKVSVLTYIFSAHDDPDEELVFERWTEKEIMNLVVCMWFMR